MKKRELQKELDTWKFVATHEIKFCEELKFPVVYPRLVRDYDELYKLHKESIERDK